MDYSDAQVLEVMSRLGVSQADLLRAQTSQRALDAVKAWIKKSYRALALECHPDRTNNDSEKAAMFQLATHVVKEIETIQPHPNPRRFKWAVRIKATATT